jgi:hypothetical protein
MALKYLKIPDYLPDYSDKGLSVVLGWNFEQNLRKKIVRKVFFAAKECYKIDPWTSSFRTAGGMSRRVALP